MAKEYRPPNYHNFYKELKQLEPNFSDEIKRYISKPVQQLLAAVNEEIVNKKDTDRETQVEVFRKLYDGLIPLVSDEDKTNEYQSSVQQIMLGALIHRYLRLYREYEQRVDAYVFRWFTSPQQCRLLRAIESVLVLNEDNVLDSLTKYSCLKAFQAYMRENNRYKEYKHFAKNNTTFLDDLAELITQEKKSAGTKLDQMQAILFISAQASYVNRIFIDILEVIAQLKIPDIDEETEIVYESFVQDLLKPIKDDKTQKRIEQLFDASYIFENLLDLLRKGELKKKLKSVLEGKSGYSLFTVCYIVFSRETEASIVKQYLEKILELSPKPDIEAQLFGLETYQAWIWNEDNHKELKCLDYNYWGGFELYDRVIREKKLELSQAVKPEQEAQQLEEGLLAAMNSVSFS